MNIQSRAHPSRLNKWFSLSLALISSSLLVSCGNFSLTKSNEKPYKAISKLIPRRVPIAVVRPNDLKELPTGADRALAWSKRLDSKRYAFFKPKNYKPATLPDARTLPTDTGLLPPLRKNP